MLRRRGKTGDIEPASPGPTREKNRQFAVGLVSAFGGALLFGMPMLMTLEMWSLGFFIDPRRLALFILLNVPLLIGLSYYAGFEETDYFVEDVMDAFTAYAVGFAAAALMLWLLAIIGPGMSADEIIGKIAIQAVPASIGAMLVRSQLGERQRKEEKRRDSHYAGGLFLTAVGALFFSISLASTEETVVLATGMSPAHFLGLMLLSLALLHGFFWVVVRRGKTDLPAGEATFSLVFFRYTVTGYAIALLISALILWIFSRTGGLGMEELVRSMVVLGLPAALGAGAARLVL
jgi:putative integral membrane protein (TIGR02587 family)